MLIALVLIGVVGCGPKLSEEEAKKIIVEKFKYPNQEYTTHNIYPEQGGKAFEMIRKLINEGYVSKTGQRDMFVWDVFAINEKGKPSLKEFYYNGFHHPQGEYRINVLTHNTIIDKIEEILIDKKNNSAVVTYIIKKVVVDPYGSAFLTNSDIENIKKYIEKRRVNFKNYDKGWRIEGEEQGVR